jgi:hypothetical protein
MPSDRATVCASGYSRVFLKTKGRSLRRGLWFKTDVSLSSRYNSEHLTGFGGLGIGGWRNYCHFSSAGHRLSTEQETGSSRLSGVWRGVGFQNTRLNTSQPEEHSRVCPRAEQWPARCDGWLPQSNAYWSAEEAF